MPFHIIVPYCKCMIIMVSLRNYWILNLNLVHYGYVFYVHMIYNDLLVPYSLKVFGAINPPNQKLVTNIEFFMYN